MRFTAMANIFLLEDDKILSKGISIALKKTSIRLQQSMGIWKHCSNTKSKSMICFCLILTCLTEMVWNFVRKFGKHRKHLYYFLTANDTEEDMLEGFGVGCDDYISKPFSIEVLRKKYWQF